MNYDQFNVSIPLTCRYEGLDPKTNCYMKNLQATKELIRAWPTDEETAKQLSANGIMIGYADDKKQIDPIFATRITRWIQGEGYGGIMTWGLNRDQPYCKKLEHLDTTTGLVGIPTGIFTAQIISRDNPK